ncbi:MAG TPA: hypothetical protein VKG62_06760 [Solirubrobacteraceae bacterium]|nr:hypothetical protein [Solirubrobacteraceae bacterium]
MGKGWKTRAIAAAAAIAVIVGVVLIATAGGGHSGGASTKTASTAAHGLGRTGQVAAAAGYLGISRSQLRRDLRSGETLAQVASRTGGHSSAGLIEALYRARAASLIAAGEAEGLSRQQQSQRLARLHERVSREVEGHLVLIGGTSAAGSLNASARYLGTTPRALVRELRAGRTLGQIADATPGRSADGLIESIVAERRARLLAAAAAGRISSAKENEALGTLKGRVTAIVEGTGAEA